MSCKYYLNCFTCPYDDCICEAKNATVKLRPTDVIEIDNPPESYTNKRQAKVFKAFNYTGIY